MPRAGCSGTIGYLAALGVLDQDTLCVHCVDVNDEDIRLLSESGAHVCLCPGSNAFLGVGHAPLDKMLQAGLLPCIGTDSRASNEDLDLWREMGLLRRLHPQLDPATVLAMATLGGARALRREADYGTLQPGRKAVYLEVELHNQSCLDAAAIEQELTSGRRPRRIGWRTY